MPFWHSYRLLATGAACAIVAAKGGIADRIGLCASPVATRKFWSDYPIEKSDSSQVADDESTVSPRMAIPGHG